MSSFIPKGQQGLLLRDPLTHNYLSAPYLPKSLLYSRNIRQNMSHKDVAGILENGSVPKKIAFFTRHNPHPGRVRHIKGLLDVPVCIVEDNYERSMMFSPPSGEDYSTYYRPQGSTRYSANATKNIPAVGIVPVTYAWKDELEKKAQSAISKALAIGGQNQLVMSSHSKLRPSSNQKGQFDDLEDDQILDLLCRILQTGSIEGCLAWLQTCTDSEKMIVLNMLRMAATGEIDPYPHSANRSQCKESSIQHENHSIQHANDIPADFEYPIENPPFKYPQHDTIVKTAHSRLASRQNQPQMSFHERLQNELNNDQASKRGGTSNSRRRSKSISGQPSSSNGSRRPKSQSQGRDNPMAEPGYPPPPVRVNVSREQLRMNFKQFKTP